MNRNELLEAFPRTAKWKWCGDSDLARLQSVKTMWDWLHKTSLSFDGSFPVTVLGITSIVSKDNEQLLQRVYNGYKYEVLLDNAHYYYCSGATSLFSILSALNKDGIQLQRVEVETI